MTLIPDLENEPLILNFEGVQSASSSFLDELLARLVVQLGLDEFNRKIQVINMMDRIRKMADVVIKQRLETPEDEAEFP